MDHTLAHQTNTLDKYFMGEMAHEERLAFEEHIFDCPECAARVKEDFAIVANLKEVLREQPVEELRVIERTAKTGGWRDWFRPLTLVPALAALALAMLTGYQNLVMMPSLLRPQVLDSTPIVATTRGANSHTLTVASGSAFFGLTVEVFAAAVYSGLVCEFVDTNQKTVTTMDCGHRASTEFSLSLLLPAAKFPSGGYTMILRPASEKQTEISRYTFIVRNQDK